MAGVLQELVAAGLIDKLDGDDRRLEKMTRASAKLSADFRKSRKLLVPAILAGLDTAVSATDPLILKANDALVAEWPTVSTVHADMPVMLLRGLLLDACAQAGEGVNAAILWLIAADTLPFSRLSREENTVRQMLVNFAEKLEKEATAISPTIPSNKSAPQEGVVKASAEAATEFEIDRAKFMGAIGAALGPSGANGQAMAPNANQHWPQNNPQHWLSEAAKRLSVAVADEIEAMAENLSGQQELFDQKLAHYSTKLQNYFQGAIDASIKKGAAEKLQIDTLWWFEAHYSPSLRISYRELDPKLAAIVMTVDLLAMCPPITPASVAHVLAEAVSRLRGASYEERVPLLNIINELKVLGKQLPDGWISVLAKTSTDDRLCLRDTAVLALCDHEADTTALLRRASVPDGTEMSLPAFARAVFRQEQALRLTLNSKAKA
jgi:hypothetical protein